MKERQIAASKIKTSPVRNMSPPRTIFSTADRGDVVRAAPRIAEALEHFRRAGVVALDGIIEPALAERCLTDIEQRQPGLVTAGDSDTRIRLGGGRYIEPLTIGGALADPELLIGNRLVEALMLAILGKFYLMHALGLIVAPPGTPHQHIHFDGLLFPETNLDGILPPATVTLTIPVVRCDENNGSTGFWTGSHRSGRHEGEPDFIPVVEPGTIMLWDYRLRHHGRANPGNTPRPLMSAVFCRNWWSEPDWNRGRRHHYLYVEPAVYAALDDTHRRRLSRAIIRN